MLLVMFDDVILIEIGVTFDLVIQRLNFASGQQMIDLLNVKVGDANVAHKSLFDRFLHLGPNGAVVKILQDGISIFFRLGFQVIQGRRGRFVTPWGVNQIEVNII